MRHNATPPKLQHVQNTQTEKDYTQVLHTLHTTMTNGQTEPKGVRDSICENCLYFKTDKNRGEWQEQGVTESITRWAGTSRLYCSV